MADDARQRILDAAFKEFSLNGKAGARMQAIAERAQVNQAMLNYYFKSKDDLLFAICEEFFANFFAELNHIRSVYQDPVETLRQAFLYLIEFGIKNPNQYKVIFFSKSDIYGTREEFVKKESMARNTHFAFKEMIRACIKAGRLQELDEDVITAALATVSHGLVTMILYRPDFFNNKTDIIARSLVDALLRGYQK